MAKFVSQYSLLPDEFYQKLESNTVKNPNILIWNSELAHSLDIDSLQLTHEELPHFLVGNFIPPGITSLAQAYSGHQFGGFNPNLGDGRARLIAEIETSQKKVYDIHSKGTGPTKFSRRGDGKATLEAALREYIVSEGLFSLSIPTTRTLAVLSTSELVKREVTHPGAILTRVTQDHIRVGTFEHFFSRNLLNHLELLIEFIIQRENLFEISLIENKSERYKALFALIVHRHAHLVAQWMSVGFVHGVLNTDNTLISGCTIDFGPCSFQEDFNPEMVLSQIDQKGRYSYKNQPEMIHWNLKSLANCFFPLIEDTPDSKIEFFDACLSDFTKKYLEHYHFLFSKKLGFSKSTEESKSILSDFLILIEKHQIDFTLSFRFLAEHLRGENFKNSAALKSLFEKFLSLEDFQKFLIHYQETLKKEGELLTIAQKMDFTNPLFIPRNHLVEKAIHRIYETGNTDYLEVWLKFLNNPYEFQNQSEEFFLPASPQEKVCSTHCNT